MSELLFFRFCGPMNQLQLQLWIWLQLQLRLLAHSLLQRVQIWLQTVDDADEDEDDDEEQQQQDGVK